MYKVYEQSTYEGRILLGTCDHRSAETLRHEYSNLEFEDVEMQQIIKDLPEVGSLDDDKLCIEMGIDPRKMESAIIVTVCLLATPVLILIAFLMEKFN